MLISGRFAQGIASGETTLTFRRWRHPKARVGGRYRYPGGEIEVTAVERVAVGSIGEEEARRAGFTSRAELMELLERSTAKLRANDEVFRVSFRATEGVSPSKAPPPTRSEIERARLDLDALDRRSRTGAWAWRVLRWIQRHPRRRAGDLAAELGAELRAVKARVRRLKSLGLTVSCEVGYELSKLGERVAEEAPPKRESASESEREPEREPEREDR